MGYVGKGLVVIVENPYIFLSMILGQIRTSRDFTLAAPAVELTSIPGIFTSNFICLICLCMAFFNAACVWLYHIQLCVCEKNVQTHVF